MPYQIKLQTDRNILRRFWRDCIQATKEGKHETTGVTASRQYFLKDGTFILDIYDIKTVGSSICPEDFRRKYIVHDIKLKKAFEEGNIILFDALREHPLRYLYPNGRYNGLIHSHPVYDLEPEYFMNLTSTHGHSENDIITLYRILGRLSHTDVTGREINIVSLLLPVFADAEHVWQLFYHKMLEPNIKGDAAEIKFFGEVHTLKPSLPREMRKKSDYVYSNLMKYASLGQPYNALFELSGFWKICAKEDLLKTNKMPQEYQSLLLEWLNRQDLMFHKVENELFDESSVLLTTWAFEPIVAGIKDKTPFIDKAQISLFGETYYHSDVSLLREHHWDIILGFKKRPEDPSYETWGCKGIIAGIQRSLERECKLKMKCSR